MPRSRASRPAPTPPPAAAPRMTWGVGAHEPIYHRLRTGNATADEWERWERETSEENLDLLERLGAGKALIACTKGFGLEYERRCERGTQR